jgi:uncharacterized protein
MIENAKFQNYLIVLVHYGFFCSLMFSCHNRESKTEIPEKTSTKEEMNKSYNPVVYFEIPATDIVRATTFYSSVFGFTFENDTIDKNEMALFPFKADHFGISGALAKGDIYKPTISGTLIYFRTESIDQTLKLVTQNGGKILYPKTSNGDLGFVAEFEDSEGNRIALHEKRDETY